MKPILLFSGGIDSYVAWHFLDKPQTVYFNLRSRYSAKEMVVVQRLIPSTIIENTINLGSREVGENAYVPFRNLHLALLATKYSDTIIIAGLKDDMVDDKNEDIFKDFSYLMSKMMGRSIQVISPFWNKTKEQVVKWYLDNGGAPYDLLNTVSCYSSSSNIYCGKCPACFRKYVALKVNGIDAGLSFHNDALMKEYLIKAIAGNHYVSERNEAILKVVLRDHPEWRS